MMPAMETAPTILELGIVLLAAVVLGWVARRVGLPAVVGYLVLGIAVSPFTPGFVADREQIQLLADAGVVLLLFEVGIEVDVPSLRRTYGGLTWAAPLQVLITTGTSAAVVYALGLALVPALVVGLSVALSSSVVIINMTRSRRRTTDPATERALLGWSVVQDLTGVSLAAVLLALVGPSGSSAPVALLGLGAFAVVAIVIALALPYVLRGLADQPDLFLIVSVASGFATAGIGAVLFGIPLALAAFVGGLAVAESPTAAEARRLLLPFRDLLAVLFFVAIGMLLDPSALARGVPWLALLLALIVVTKVGAAYLLARRALPTVRPFQLAVGLGQMGEFSFVLASVLLAAGALDDSIYAALVGTVAISIAASSVLVRQVRVTSLVVASG